jgi:elongation factor Ts
MSNISASLVKELRERTGAGMMECKKALAENNGDIEAAIEAMRISGQAKAAKKAGRIAAEGLIIAKQNGNTAIMVEINSETDFVAKGDDFKGFCNDVADAALANRTANLDALLAAPLNGKNVEEIRKDMIAKIGENLNVRRVCLVESETLGVYLHGAKIGVIVAMNGGDVALAKDIAMHVAASRPVCVSDKDIDPELLVKERTIATAKAQESGKPANIIEKMVDGQIAKFLKEVTLLGQPFVKDPDTTVEKLLKSSGATVVSFERFEVGEGIEKKTDNFAEEVMQQVNAAGR